MKRENINLIFAALIISTTTSTTPYLLGATIDTSKPTSLVTLAIIASACIITTPCLKLLTNIYVQRISTTTKFILKKRLINNLLRHGFFSLRQGGNIIDLVDGDVDGTIYLYHRLYYDIALNTSLITASLGAIIYINPHLLLAALSSIFLSIFFCYTTQKKANTLFEELVNENTHLLGSICDDIRLNSTTSSYSKQIQHIEKLSVRAQLKSSMLTAFSLSSYIVGITSLILIGGGYIFAEKITTGEMFSAVIYIERALSPTSALISIYYSTRESSTRLKRVKHNISR